MIQFVQHASCGCIHPPGTYPGRALCGVVILGPSWDRAEKCPACEALFRSGPPCPLCPDPCPNSCGSLDYGDELEVE